MLSVVDLTYRLGAGNYTKYLRTIGENNIYTIRQTTDNGNKR